MAIIPFHQENPRPPRLLDSATFCRISPLSSPTQRQIRSLIDRLQVLMWKNPRLATWLLEFVDVFLTKHGA